MFLLLLPEQSIMIFKIRQKRQLRMKAAHERERNISGAQCDSYCAEQSSVKLNERFLCFPIINPKTFDVR